MSHEFTSPASKEALHRILKSAFTAKDLADLLPSVDSSMPIPQAKELIERLGCRVLGVKKDGFYAGWVDIDDLDKEGTCLDIMRSFSERPILHESTPFKEVVLSLIKNNLVFVNIMGETAAAVCPCDLQDAPMRMWLFGLITLMETLMHRAIASNLPDDSWQEYISAGRLERAKALYKERLRRNEQIELDDCLQFSDKADILLRYPPSAEVLGFTSKRRGQDFFSKLESLRNSLAHSQSFPENSLPTIAALAISLDLLLEAEANPVLGPAAGTTPLQAVKSLAARLREQDIEIAGLKVLPGVATPPPTPKGKLPPKTVTPRNTSSPAAETGRTPEHNISSVPASDNL